ncbi:DUF6544 family protein, partial [Rubrivirga sp.]|uniref:DUF6544 family protein n=1 Tax=Rubrivirga sp. TaxID=1885344 RepID=UPI003C761CBC
VVWQAAGDDHARYTLAVDGETITVTLHVDGDGAVQEVALDRWGDPDGEAARLYPYGFRVEAEGTFGGVTIPTRITGGWGYGTDSYDPDSGASFTVTHLDLADGGPHS